jgi:hypothetical protein
MIQISHWQAFKKLANARFCYKVSFYLCKRWGDPCPGRVSLLSFLSAVHCTCTIRCNDFKEHNVKKRLDFPVPSQDVTYQTLPGRE